ncbi:4-hydroxyphenylpyruvate dioxygenase [Streptomyces sp. WM6372]|uniref:4-hydroxyphenylpyruvate dioxygenase n=1 Tax=Streptomyces sp. WM6372 TaxID=1415555 RepID=UPI0006AEBB2A|nr:4-hydroxyphenylpyruvate dioxygenase [Streptomyces sp. WM6372]KOU27424.1 4-hydroxyphenylpyruvate dioxygenase [Streptomyces sp. WM6372]
MTSSQANTVVDDFELDYVEMYVRDMDEQVVLWRDSYGFVEAAVGGSPEQGFRATVMSQGAMRLVLTEATAERHPASDYVLAHGDGIANIALRTGDVRSAFRQAVDNGAQVLAEPVEHAGDDVAVSATVSGFGDVVHTLVQRRSGQEAGLPAGFRPFPGSAAPTEPVADGLRLLEIDHFAVCANVGELDAIVELYERSFGFDEIFTERIVVGSQAMLSKVVQSKSGEVTFTILQPDPAADPGQIDEFLKNHVGSGVQHVAFAADDVVRSVGALAGRGVEFLTTPDAYYSLLKQRISLSKHSLESLHELNVLVDEDHAGQLFQIFARSTHPRRTLFFEVIERCGAQTFGSSNIKALYEAVEMERLAHQNDSL